MLLPGEVAVDILIDDRTPSPEGLNEASIASLARHVLSQEGKSGRWEIGLQFLDDAEMQHAHAAFMGDDSPTDIMTFPYENEEFADLPGIDEESVQGGDLMISVERAAEHAEEAGWSTVEELRFLVIHGILHILGWDDQTDDARGRMLARQSELLASWREG